MHDGIRTRTLMPPRPSMDVSDDDPMTCPECGWRGERHECRAKGVRSNRPLSARSGVQYSCPRCGELLDSSYSMVS